jgi:hypothetical protein
MSTQKYKIKGENKTMTVYENKVVLEGEKGFLVAAMGVNQGQKTFAYESISSIEFEEATLMGNGRITFNIQGDTGRNSVLGMGKMMIGVQNENAFQYQKRSQNQEVIAAKNYIEDQMIKAKQSSKTVVNSVSPADELRKYKQLLDDGIINQAEFDEKKKQLL